jgi:hypothetical protein
MAATWQLGRLNRRVLYPKSLCANTNEDGTRRQAGHLLDWDAICGYSSQADSQPAARGPVALKGAVGGAGDLYNMHVSLCAM